MSGFLVPREMQPLLFLDRLTNEEVEPLLHRLAAMSLEARAAREGQLSQSHAEVLARVRGGRHLSPIDPTLISVARPPDCLSRAGWPWR